MHLLNKTFKVPVMSVLRYCGIIAFICFFANAKKPDSSTPEIFVGTSPCGQSVRTMVSIPIESECEMVQWQLALFKSPENGTPSRFELKYTYGMSKAGTQGFINDGTSTSVGGKWSSQSGNASLPGKLVVQLLSAQMKPLSFAKLNTDMLHLLDPEGKLMIGNAAWSYTLNRAKN